MKRLLAVSWEMPPMYGPRGVQVSRTLGQLAVRGWRPLAVCLAPRPGGAHWPTGVPVDSPPGVELVRVQSPEEWLAVRAAWRIIPALRDFPDSARVWVARATDAAVRIAASQDCGGLVTFAQPWSDHLVGLRVSQATRLPWVAHFSDPWADSPFATPRQRSIWRRMEADVVRRASALVFVTAETADLVMEKYPSEWRRKVSVVPHGFEPLLAGGTPRPVRRGDPRMRIVYTGRFYAGLRTPIPLFRALAALHLRHRLDGLLEVLLVGPTVDQFERDAESFGIGALVRFRGRVPPAEAAAAAADADVLLVIDAPSERPSVFLPSKLIEYLAFRRPILGITPERGASAALLRRLGCPSVPPDDVAAISSALADLLRRHQTGTLEVGDSFDRVAAEFTIAHTAERLHHVLIRAFDEPRTL